MRVLISLCLFFASSWALAQNASDAIASHDHHVYASLGFNQGGLTFGAEYEYPAHSTFGIGGYFRYGGKEDEGVNLTPGVIALGGFIRPHFQRRAWDLFVSPGFGIFMIDGEDIGTGSDEAGDETGIGPSFEVGLTYQFTDSIAVGAEYFQARPWFADDWQGAALLDGVYAKGRFGF